MVIYDTVPEEVMRQTSEENKVDLLRFLISQKGRFFNSKKLAEIVGYPIRGTQPELRKAITELIDQGQPIVANKYGFAYADHSAMILFYIQQLENRRLGLDRRINKLKETYRKIAGVDDEHKGISEI